jgi:muramoyltetrapeptide carboxypeptidase
MLWQIRQNGIFDKINGLVFGLLEPEVQKEETEFQNIKSILESVTQNYTFPVLYNAQFGHIYPSWVLQNGRKVEIIKNQIFIK